VIAQARAWVRRAAQFPPDPGAQQLAAMLADPAGLPFAVAFIDGVVRPEDTQVAARNLRTLARNPPSFLPMHLRAAIRAGALAAIPAPRPAIPIARRTLRRLVSHLVIDASDAQLGGHLTGSR